MFGLGRKIVRVLVVVLNRVCCVGGGIDCVRRVGVGVVSLRPNRGWRV